MKYYDWKKIQQEYDSGLSTTDVIKKYGMSKNTLHFATKSGKLITRNQSEAGVIFQSNRLTPKNGKKVCVSCKKVRSITHFISHPKYKTGFSGKCIECRNEFARDTIIKKIRKYILDDVKRGCVDCGNTDIYTLQFDHSNGNRIYTVPQLMCQQVAPKKIVEELDKCEIRCASCHLKRHLLETPSEFILLLKEVTQL